MYSNSTKVKPVHDLAPEQQKALAVLLNNLPKASELFLQSDQPTNKFCTTGFIAFSNKPLPKLPHEETWIWNQSNGKVTVKTDGGNFVTLQKLNTRKKKNCPKPPSYKVWVCYVSRSIQQPHYLNFIWCEKGVPSKDSSSSGSPDSNRSESSDGSSENTSPDFYHQQSFEQSSPPDNSFASSYRRSSAPCIPLQAPSQLLNFQNSSNTIPSIYPNISSNCKIDTLLSPTSNLSPSISSTISPIPQSKNNELTQNPQLPSLEALVFLRNGKSNQISMAYSRKRSLPHIAPHMAKKAKFNHHPATFSLPPLRIPATSTTNGFSFKDQKLPPSREVNGTTQPTNTNIHKVCNFNNNIELL